MNLEGAETLESGAGRKVNSCTSRDPEWRRGVIEGHVTTVEEDGRKVEDGMFAKWRDFISFANIPL